MIKNNKFYVKNLKNVVFIGYNPDLLKFIEINNEFQIDSDIVTSSDQSKEINHKHVIFVESSIVIYPMNDLQKEGKLDLHMFLKHKK